MEVFLVLAFKMLPFILTGSRINITFS